MTLPGVLALAEVADVLERAPRQNRLPELLGDFGSDVLLTAAQANQLASSVRHHAALLESPAGATRQLDPVLDGPVNPDD